MSQTFKSLCSVSGYLQGMEINEKGNKMKYRFMKGKKIIFFTRDTVNLTCLSFSKITFELSKAERWQFKNEKMHRVLDIGIQWLMFPF